ncbi:MAG: type II toxin-antitoxin system ParD family antitoxin [Kiritimatiellae bacterium]|nr:type II toxin-antitoxin system ParD family antitoxin [Kiritimatiellia bacterium]
MNITLPDEMKDFVSTEIKQGGYSSASEFIRALIRAYQEKKETEKLERLLLQGLEGGMTPFTKSDMKDIRKRARARLRNLRATE